MDLLKEKNFNINDLFKSYDIISDSNFNEDNLNNLISLLNTELNNTILENYKELENNLLGHLKISKIIYENKQYLLENKDNWEINKLGEYLKKKEVEIQEKYQNIINTKNKLIGYLIKDKNDIYQNFINKLFEEFDFIKNENFILLDEILNLGQLYCISKIIWYSQLNKIINKNNYEIINKKLEDIKIFLINNLEINFNNIDNTSTNEFIFYEIDIVFKCYIFLDNEKFNLNKFIKLIENNNKLVYLIEQNFDKIKNSIIYYYILYKLGWIEKQLNKLLEFFDNSIWSDLRSQLKLLNRIYISKFNNSYINKLLLRVNNQIKIILDKETKLELIKKIKLYETKFLFIENNIEDNNDKIILQFHQKFNITIKEFLIETIENLFKFDNFPQNLKKYLFKQSMNFLIRIDKLLDTLYFLDNIKNLKLNIKEEIKKNISIYIKNDNLIDKIINIIK